MIVRRPYILVLAALMSGCIKTPPVVIVDRQTVLEEQAAGSFDGLGDELAQAGIIPGPVPYTRGVLQAAGVPVGGADQALTPDEALTDAELTDQLLVRRCIGEALDGRLVETPQTCTETPSGTPKVQLVERANRKRSQIWRYLERHHPAAAPAHVRRAWRRIHLEGVICGGQIQREDGAWEVKKC